MYPTRESLQLFGAVIILLLIWVTSLILASPLFIYKKLDHHDFKLNGTDLDGLNFCFEDWPVSHGRAYFSIFSIIVQYILPIIIVSVSNLNIYLIKKNNDVLRQKKRKDSTINEFKSR